jgi:hypothetical protein
MAGAYPETRSLGRTEVNNNRADADTNGDGMIELSSSCMRAGVFAEAGGSSAPIAAPDQTMSS